MAKKPPKEETTRRAPWAPRARVPKRPGTKKTKMPPIPKQFRMAPMTSGFECEPKQGRPPYAPTDGDRAFVKKLASYGMTAEQICSLIESRYGEMVKTTTLRKYFRIELDIGEEELVIWAADKIVHHMNNGSLAAAIFIAKTRGRGRWSSQLNLADPNGNPLAAPNVIVAFGKDDDTEETNNVVNTGEESEH